jgi:hypothetical protein
MSCITFKPAIGPLDDITKVHKRTKKDPKCVISTSIGHIIREHNPEIASYIYPV